MQMAQSVIVVGYSRELESRACILLSSDGEYCKRGMSVMHISTADEWTDVYCLVKKHLVVVCFGASWCGPCKRIAAEYEAMAREYSDVRFVKVDVDEARGKIEAVRTVRSLPSFVFVRNQEQVDAMKGAHMDQLRAKIEGLRGVL